MVSAGILIFTGFVPMVKMAIAIGAGFTITKKDLFPAMAARGASHIAMDIALPCLIFSSIVPSFNSSNIASLGPLCMSALLYQFCGALLGFLIREIFYVPDDFQYGIIICCAFSNWGNLPTAIVQSVAANAPFNGPSDQALGVAYVAVFILIYNVSFFGMGLCRICALDFRPRPEGYTQPTPAQKWAARRLWFRSLRHRLSRRTQPAAKQVEEVELPVREDVEKGVEPLDTPPPQQLGYAGGAQLTMEKSNALHRYRSHQSMVNSQQRRLDFDGPSPAPLGVSLPSPAEEEKPSLLPTTTPATTSEAKDQEAETPPPRLTPLQTVLAAIRVIITPVTISLFISLPVALIHPLKALFVVEEGWTGGRMPNAPDGRPPLAFVNDSALFLGAMTVPLALILLGSSFARLKIPRPFSKLPIAAMVSVVLVKMVIVPVIGVLFTTGLSNHTTLYPKENKILLFVAMLLSGTPAAANQLVITQIYSPTGTAHTLAAFMSLQYAVMFFATAGLTIVSLQIVG